MQGNRKTLTRVVVALSVTVMIAFAGIALAGGVKECGGPGQSQSTEEIIKLLQTNIQNFS
jgi:hypothetical protein